MPRSGAEDRHRATVEIGVRQEVDVGEGVIDPRTAERADDDDAGGAAVDRREHRQLGVGFVLVRSGAFERDPRRIERGQPRFADGIAVTDPQVEGHPERLRVARATVGGDDETDLGIPAGPVEIELRSVGHGAVGQDQGIHGSMLPCRPSPPGAVRC